MSAFAHASNDPYDIAFARYFESWLHYLLRDAPRAMAAANQALALSEERGFSPFLTAFSQGISGWARAQLGSPGEGVSLIRRNLSGFVESGSGVMIGDILTRLAEAQVLDGTIESRFLNGRLDGRISSERGKLGERSPPTVSQRTGFKKHPPCCRVRHCGRPTDVTVACRWTGQKPNDSKSRQDMGG